MQNLYFIDFENIQHFAYESLDKNRDMAVIFIGHNQSKINFEIVSKTQRLGESVHWIKMAGSGRNALDFHIAYYLGYFVAAQEDKPEKCKVHIVSNDSDYDILIKHIQENGIPCERLAIKIPEQTTQPSQSQAATEKVIQTEIIRFQSNSEVYEHLVSTLKKQEKLKRPRTSKTLKNHITAHYHKKKDNLQAEKVLDLLKANKKIIINGERISYLF